MNTLEELQADAEKYGFLVTRTGRGRGVTYQLREKNSRLVWGGLLKNDVHMFLSGYKLAFYRRSK